MKTAQIDIVSQRDLWNALPPEIQEKVEKREQANYREGRSGATFRSYYQWEVTSLIEYGMKCEQPQMVFSTWRTAGHQWIAEFWVNELARPDKPEQVNWHGQNTSRWSYAGCLLVEAETGDVSTHH